MLLLCFDVVHEGNATYDYICKQLLIFDNGKIFSEFKNDCIDFGFAFLDILKGNLLKKFESATRKEILSFTIYK